MIKRGTIYAGTKTQGKRVPVYIRRGKPEKLEKEDVQMRACKAAIVILDVLHERNVF